MTDGPKILPVGQDEDLTVPATTGSPSWKSIEQEKIDKIERLLHDTLPEDQFRLIKQEAEKQALFQKHRSLVQSANNAGINLAQPGKVLFRVKNVEQAISALENMADKGEPYTSERKLAAVLGCGYRTVGNAIKQSAKLQQWRNATKSDDESVPPAAMDELAEKHRQLAVLSDHEYSRAMQDILSAAKEAERNEIEAMPEDKKRELARTYLRGKEWEFGDTGEHERSQMAYRRL